MTDSHNCLFYHKGWVQDVSVLTLHRIIVRAGSGQERLNNVQSAKPALKKHNSTSANYGLAWRVWLNGWSLARQARRSRLAPETKLAMFNMTSCVYSNACRRSPKRSAGEWGSAMLRVQRAVFTFSPKQTCTQPCWKPQKNQIRPNIKTIVEIIHFSTLICTQNRPFIPISALTCTQNTHFIPISALTCTQNTHFISISALMCTQMRDFELKSSGLSYKKRGFRTCEFATLIRLYDSEVQA